MMGSIFFIINFFILLSISSCAQFDSHNEKCNLYPERGTCQNDFLMKWYYHPHSGKCKKFFYSGCDGNENRFDTEEECLLQCTYGRKGQELENYKRCHEPYDKGDCWGSFERWYFDTDKGECICTNYTGCGGTGNLFYSFNHCMEICGDFSKNTYQRNYYERSEHGKVKRQRLQNYYEQSSRRQESGPINLQPYQQHYDERIHQTGPSYDQRIHQADPSYDGRVHQTQPSYDPRVHQAPPSYDPRVHQAPPSYDQAVHQAPPSYDHRVQQAAPSYDPRVHQAPPSYDPRIHQTAPSHDGRVHQTAPSYDPRVHQTAPSHDGRIHQTVPSHDGRVHQTVPSHDGRVHQAPPSYDRRVQEESWRPRPPKTENEPRYHQQQKEYEERLQEYYRKRDEYFRQQQSKKMVDFKSEKQDLHRQSRPVSLSEDLSYTPTLTVEDVIPHDPHPWHQVETQYPARHRWFRKFIKRSNKNEVKNDMKKEDEVKKRKIRSTYQSNQINYNYRGSAYSSYYDSRYYSRKWWENDKYPIKEGTMESFVAYAPYRRYNRLTTIEKTEPLSENFNLRFLNDQPIRRESDFEPIDTEELANFKLPPHLTNLPLSEKKKYWKKIVNRRYEEAKKLRNQKIKAVTMYAKYLENDLRKKMRGKIKVHYVPEYKYYLVRREEYPNNENNLTTTMKTYQKNMDDQSYYNQYITTTTEAPTTTVQSFEITTKSPTLYIPTLPTTSRIYTTPIITTASTTTTSTTTATPKPTEIVWNYHSKKPLDIESTINEFTSQQNIKSIKPNIQFPPITQIIDLDDYQPFDNNSQEDSDFDDIITSTYQPKEIPTVFVTSYPPPTTTQSPIIDDPIQIVFPTKKPITNGWTFDDDDDDVFFFKPDAKKQNNKI